MAIISASELKASREAIEAKVNAVSDADADRAIALAEALMNRVLGYKVANAATSVAVTSAAGDLLSVPERIRTVSAVTDAYPGGSPATVDAARYGLRNRGFALYRDYGWIQGNAVVVTGTFGYATTDDEYVLAKQFVLMYAVRHLQKTASGSKLPSLAGAYLRSYSSENAAFDFFTPRGELSGYQDLDDLLLQIGRHPSKTSGLYTVGLTTPTPRMNAFDAIISGVDEEPP